MFVFILKFWNSKVSILEQPIYIEATVIDMIYNFEVEWFLSVFLGVQMFFRHCQINL